MGFELLGAGLPFPQAYNSGKCDMAAVAQMLCK
jgi:hypothetical protein